LSWLPPSLASCLACYCSSASSRSSKWSFGDPLRAAAASLLRRRLVCRVWHCFRTLCGTRGRSACSLRPLLVSPRPLYIQGAWYAPRALRHVGSHRCCGLSHYCHDDECARVPIASCRLPPALAPCRVASTLLSTNGWCSVLTMGLCRAPVAGLMCCIKVATTAPRRSR
jgi:hypothetical protein